MIPLRVHIIWLLVIFVSLGFLSVTIFILSVRPSLIFLGAILLTTTTSINRTHLIVDVFFILVAEDGVSCSDAFKLVLTLVLYFFRSALSRIWVVQLGKLVKALFDV